MSQRRIIKENHGSPIPQIQVGYSQLQLGSSPRPVEGTYAFEVEPKDLSHLLMTVANSPGKSPGDALIAFGGRLGQIRLVSLAFSQEFARLDGHKGAVTDLVCHPSKDNFILSCSKDGTVRLWDINTRAFLSGAYLWPIRRNYARWKLKGEIAKFRLPSIERLESITQTITSLDCTTLFPNKLHGAQIDCLKLVHSKVVSKSTNGKVFCWAFESGEIISSFHVRDSVPNACRFGISPNGQYLCVGSSTGAVYVRSLSDGKQLAELRSRRSTNPILSCTFARRG
ncbi:hypothetical protein L0F63_001142, partial [Massospora cicadina]